MKAWRSGRRGRPRSEQPAIDQGTPELRARRAALAGGGDPALTESPLGLMLARGLVTPQQHEAGCYYAFLYRRTIGRTQIASDRVYARIAAGAGGEPGGGPLSEGAQVRMEGLFRLGKNRLLAASRRICDATENLAVFARPPRFLDTGGRRPASARRADATELEAVLDGLDILAACYGRSAGRIGRMDAHKAPSLAQRRDDFSVDRNRNKSI
jgi:hypothetical protein